MQRGLVAAQFYVDVILCKSFPEVHHIALIGDGHGLLVFSGLQHPGNECIQIVEDLIHPALRMSCMGCLRVDLGHHTHAACYHRGFWLCATHATQPRGHEDLSATIGGILVHHTCCVEHSDVGAVHDALRADIHVRPGGHLTVLRHAKCIEFFPVVGFGIVGYHHAVGHHHPRGIDMRREQSHRVTTVHHKCLFFCHGGQVLHGEQVLRPVLEDRSVAAIGDEFMRMLCYHRIQVVLYHHHDGRSLPALMGIMVQVTGIHSIGRTKPVHIDSSVSA